MPATRFRSLRRQVFPCIWSRRRNVGWSTVYTAAEIYWSLHGVSIAGYADAVAYANDVLRNNLRHSEVITASIFDILAALIY